MKIIYLIEQIAVGIAHHIRQVRWIDLVRATHITV